MRMQFKMNASFWVIAVIAIMFNYSCSQNQTEQSVKEIAKDSIHLINDLNLEQTRSIKFELCDGNIDGYWVRLPYKYNTQKKWPILVHFHGAGLLEKKLDSLCNSGPAYYAVHDSSQEGEFRNQLFSNFIMITPHLKGTGEKHPKFWPSWTKEFKTIDAILDSVLNNYSGNKEKIYLTGLSLGGAACWLLPNYLKTPIAAVVPVCGTPDGYFGKNDPRPKEDTSTEEMDIFNANPFKTIPVWNTCNARDTWLKRNFQKTAIKNIETLGGDKFLNLTTVSPTDSVYLKHHRIFTSFDEEGHNAWTKTYTSIHIYKWMLTFTNRDGKVIQEN